MARITSGRIEGSGAFCPGPPVIKSGPGPHTVPDEAYAVIGDTDAAESDVVFHLPPPDAIPNRVLVFKKKGNSGDVLLEPGEHTIDGYTGYVAITVPNDVIAIQGLSATEWIVLWTS